MRSADGMGEEIYLMLHWKRVQKLISVGDEKAAEHVLACEPAETRYRFISNDDAKVIGEQKAQ